MMMGVVAKTDSAQAKVDPGPRLINRELSWLTSSERVLDLASDPGVPLLERVKFCGIFSLMLDEFIAREAPDFAPPELRGIAIVQGHCHQQALAGIENEVSLLSRVPCGIPIRTKLMPGRAKAWTQTVSSIFSKPLLQCFEAKSICFVEPCDEGIRLVG